MNVNKKLLPIKAHYFVKNAASAAIVPFIPVITKNLKFPSSALGLIATVIPALSLVTKPLAGALADKFGAHKLFYLFFLIINMGFAMMINHLPPLPSDQAVIMRCSESTDIIVSTRRGSDECFMKRLRALMDNLPLPCQMSCDETQDLINVMNEHKRDWDIQNATDGFTVGISFPLAKENGNIHMKLDYIETSRQSWLDPSCLETKEWKCQLACKNPMVHDLVTTLPKEESPVTAYPQFWVIAATVIILKLSSRNLATMGDTICFKLLGDKPNSVGYQMMWGGMAWGLVTVGTSYMVDMLSEGEPMKDFTYAVYISGIFFFLNLIVGISFNIEVGQVVMLLLLFSLNPKVGREKTPGVISKNTYHAFANPSSSIFLAWVIACGIFSAMTWNFLFRYIIEVAEEGGCSDATWVKTLDGFTLGVQCFLGEIPFFYFSNWMLNHLGHSTCMSLVLLGFSMRFTLYYFLTSPWWILPIEILNGLTYGTFQATMLTYANAIALEGTSATVQGVVSGVFEGIGVMAGVIIGNQLIDMLGVRKLFLLAGISAAVLALSNIALMVMKTLRNSASLSIHDRKIPPEQFEVSDHEEDGK